VFTAGYSRCPHISNGLLRMQSEVRDDPLDSGLADPLRLPPFDAEDGTTIHVIIETPKGSRNKYAFDPNLKIFILKRVLPVGIGLSV
jgi:hypothetical protein